MRQTQSPKPFTLEQHIEVADLLSTCLFHLTTTFFTLQAAYPKSSPQMRAAALSIGHPSGPFLALRSHLDDAFFREYPRADPGDSPYFPWTCMDRFIRRELPTTFFFRAKKPSRLPAEQHRSIGAKLNLLEAVLWDVAGRIWGTYGHRSLPGKDLEKILIKQQHIPRLRAALCDAACSELRGNQPLEWYSAGLNAGRLQQAIG